MLIKLWRNYSYAIILLVFSLVGVFFVSNSFSVSTEDYMKVTVSKGETLWEISEKYSEQHHLSKAEFVEWVEKNNGISGDHIYAGDQLMIPVENSLIEIEINELASK